MKPIKKLDIVKNIMESSNKKKSFEVSPLDVNLAKIQYNLIERLEREMAEYGDFAAVIEKFTSKNPKLRIGDIVVRCSHLPKAESKLERSLDLTIFDKHNPEKFITHNLAVGKKQAILDKVKQKEFFETCKSLVLEFNEKLGK